LAKFQQLFNTLLAHVLLFPGMPNANSEPVRFYLQTVPLKKQPVAGSTNFIQSIGEENLFFHSKDFFDSLERDLALAKSTICVEMYIWSNDDIGNRFFKILESAALRGVKVRLVLDGFGSWFWLRANQSALQSCVTQVRIFHPVEWFSLKVFSEGISRFLARMNRRNHKKLVVIDNAVAYVGSMNITTHSLAWKECGLRLKGSPVPLLQELFDDVWYRTGESQERRTPRNAWLQKQLLESETVRSNQFDRLRKVNLNDLKKRIHQAQKRVWLMTPYFVPPFGLFIALLKAAKRGVDVRLILPRKSDILVLRWVARLYYRYMLKAGVKIFEYLPEVLHAKISMIDSWAFMGSSNLNRRSLNLPRFRARYCALLSLSFSASRAPAKKRYGHVGANTAVYSA